MASESGERATHLRAVLANVADLLGLVTGRRTLLATMLQEVSLVVLGAIKLFPAPLTGELLGRVVDLHVGGAVGLFEEPHPTHGAGHLSAGVVDSEMLAQGPDTGKRFAALST